MMDIVFSSATQPAAAIRAGHVSATAVLEAHLAHVDRYNPVGGIQLEAQRHV